MREAEVRRRGLSLRWRVILIVAGISLLLVTPVMLFVGRRYQNAYREAYWSKGDLATIQLRQTIRAISPFVETVGDAPGLAAYLQDIGDNVSDFDFIALVDGNGRVLMHSIPGYGGRTLGELQDLAAGATERGPSDDPYSVVRRELPFGLTYLIWRSMPMPGNDQDELYIVVGERAALVDPPIYPLIAIGLLAAVLLVVLIRISLDRLVITPLNLLAEGAAIVGAGELSHKIPLDRDDEFGFVAQAFNEMAGRLEEIVTRLEQTVTERTAALRRRNAQLEAASLVGQEAARERNVNAVLDTAVRAISDNFGFYHTGIFIVDDNKEWAILRSASSEGGRRMLARNHRLQVGQVGIVGHVAASGRPRVALNVGQDAVWFNNPDLPMTKSEMALPLISEGEVIGVLDVQSQQVSAFTDEDISTLQLMADQLTVALNNARALEVTESALAELRALQVDYARSGWARISNRARPVAYEYDRVDTAPVAPLEVPAELAEGKVEHSLVTDGGVPMVLEELRAGNQVLGYLGLSDSRRTWSEEELAFIHSVGEQVALALDNARLFEDTQRNERQQYLISQVLQAASAPGLSSDEALVEIARVLAHGLDTAVAILTFEQPQVPVIQAHTFVSPEGESLPLFVEGSGLSSEQSAFLQGLVETDGGSVAPLLGVTESPSAADSDARRALRAYDTERVLYVPIRRASGLTSGCISLVQYLDAPHFDSDTRELMETLAGQIAVVLENLTLSEETRQRSEELRQLYRISLRLAELLEPDDVLDELVSQGAVLLNADGANLWVYDANAEILALRSSNGGGAEGELGRRLRLGQGLAGMALAQQQTVRVDDYASWQDRIPDLVSPTLHATMAIPLVGRFGPLGVLVLLSRQIGFFGEREAGLGELFAAQGAAALENARLNQDAQRRAEEFSQLYEAGTDLITILDLEELLDRAADWARRIFAAERVVVTVRDPESGAFIRGQCASVPEYLVSQGADQAATDGLVERLMVSRESLLLPDARETAAPDAAELPRTDMLSQMGAPLQVGDEVLGAILVNGAAIEQFTRRDLDLLEFLATQVASALQNSIQFRQTEEALSVVGQQARYQTNISQAVALLNERGTDATGDVLRLLGEAAEVPTVLYFESRVNGDGSYWCLQAQWAAPGRAPDRLQDQRFQRLSTSETDPWVRSLRQQGYVMGKLRHLPGAKDDGIVASGSGAVLGLAVPGETRIPAFVALLRDDAVLWEDQEIVALQTAAAALSNTLARERLFAQVQQTLSETEALYRGSAALTQASAYQDILDVLLAHTILGEEPHMSTLHLFDQMWSGEELPTYSEVVASWSREPQAELRRRYEVRKYADSLRAMEDGAPVFVEDLERDAMPDRRLHALFERAMGAQSVVLVPLVVSGQKIGFLHADYPTSRTFPESARRRLVSLAQQAAIAALNIRQLRASEARARREQLIRQISSHIQEAPDVQGVLETAVRELGRAFGTSHNRIQFRPPSGAGGSPGDGDA